MSYWCTNVNSCPSCHGTHSVHFYGGNFPTDTFYFNCPQTHNEVAVSNVIYGTNGRLLVWAEQFTPPPAPSVQVRLTRE